MDQSSSRSSGIPRLSRLPLPRGTATIAAASDPTDNVPKDLLLPKQLVQDAVDSPGSANLDQATASEQKQQTAVNVHMIEHSPASHNEGRHLGFSNKARTLPRRARPSLLDRTIKTLSQIPPSPSPRGPKSGFFPPGSPVAISARPASSLSRSRPSTSHGQRAPLLYGLPTPRPASPSKRQLEPTTGNRSPQGNQSKRSVSSFGLQGVPPLGAELNNEVEVTPWKPRLVPSIRLRTRNQDSGVPNKPVLKLARGSQTLAARPNPQRPPMQDAFSKPAQKVNNKQGDKTLKGPHKVSPTPSSESANTCPTFSPLSESSSNTSSEPDGPSSHSTGLDRRQASRASSAALRETIAEAKAARRGASKRQGKVLAESNQKSDDPFSIEIGGSNKGLLHKRVAAARTDGRLNIAALGLKEMPSEVINMYNIDPNDGAWYESVDLVRLVAADNEFELLSDEILPDVSADGNDEYPGNLFGGLETLDLHGNQLQYLPMGLRRLECLTTLNLSRNKLANEILEVISQVRSLRELRLAGNALHGTLGPQLGNLTNLEVLDLHGNSVSALPSNMDEICSLRILNVAGNKLVSLPFDLLASLPLMELDAARNRLSGTLLSVNVQHLSQLRALDVSSNALTSVTATGVVELPYLQTLNVAENRLTALPEMTTWTELITLTAGGNKLTVVPESIISLNKLKSIDLSRNDIKVLDERFGAMANLAILRVANNPLRERRFLTMDTGDLKRELRDRLITTQSSDGLVDDPISYDKSGSAVTGNPPTSKTWRVKSDGTLDSSSSNLQTIETSDIEGLDQSVDVRTLALHHNLLSQLPQALMLLGHSLRILDMSRNKFSGSSYLMADLSLPNLRQLDLSTNAFTSLSPLIDHLTAPQLAELNVSRNRLTSLRILRNAFPSLTSVSASDNRISTLQVESADGLQVLDIGGNEIEHLEPRLGLLGAKGLRTLVVGGNRFRVPSRDVINKGTEAVLAWLKSRIPDEEMQNLG